MPNMKMRICSATHAFIDALEWLDHGEVRLRGWIFREDSALASVDIALDDQLWIAGCRLQLRPDVLVAYTPILGRRLHLERSGFDVTAPLPPGFSIRPRTVITLTPSQEDGSQMDSFVTYLGDGGESELPPVHLQDRIGGSTNFLPVARQLTCFLLTCIGKWKSVFAAEAILDWGCGCGRVIAQLKTLLPPAKLYGCDIDAEAIAWDQENLPGPSFTRIEPHPPTSYQDASFDIVYGVSVMTHLGEEAQHAWLQELRRITRPGGVLALSVIGTDLRATNMPAHLSSQFAADGFVAFVPNYSELLDKHSHAGYYQEAYHSLDYICSVWGKYFEILECVVTGHQDLVLLRRPS